MNSLHQKLPGMTDVLAWMSLPVRHKWLHPAAPKLTPGLSGEMVLQRAGYACIDHLARNEQAARTGDAEGIHQMRVAVRRWRATLSALAPFMPQAPRRSGSDELRWIADALGEARNLDVFASALLTPACATFPWSSELERLAMAIDRRRRIAHAAVRGAISSARYGASVRALANWLDACEWREAVTWALRRPIGELAPILLRPILSPGKKARRVFRPAVGKRASPAAPHFEKTSLYDGAWAHSLRTRKHLQGLFSTLSNYRTISATSTMCGLPMTLWRAWPIPTPSIPALTMLGAASLLGTNGVSPLTSRCLDDACGNFSRPSPSGSAPCFRMIWIKALRVLSPRVMTRR